MKTSIPPFPAKGQSVRYPNLERNFLIVLAMVTFASIALGIYRMEKVESDRARIQRQQEQKALDNHSAIEVTP